MLTAFTGPLAKGYIQEQALVLIVLNLARLVRSLAHGGRYLINTRFLLELPLVCGSTSSPSPSSPSSLALAAGQTRSRVFTVLSVFHFFGNCRTGPFPKVAAPFYIPPLGKHGGSTFSESSAARVSVCLLILDIRVGVRRHLTIALVCLSLMASGVKPLFMCFLAICVSSLEKCLFKS